MPIDAQIPLQIKPVQLDSPLSTYANVMAIQNATNQNRLSNMQIEEVQRKRAEEEAVRNVFQQFPNDRKAAINALMGKGYYSQAQGLEAGERAANKDRVEIDQKELENAAKRMDIVGSEFAVLARNPNVTPDSVLQLVRRLQGEKVLPPGWESNIPPNQLGNMSGWVSDVANRSAKGREYLKEFESKPELMDDGKRKWFVEKNPRLATFGQEISAPIPMQTTPGQDLTAQTAREGQAITREGQANQNWSVDAQRGVRVNRITGETQPLMMGGAPLGPNPKEAREDTDALRKEFEAKPAVKEYRATIPVLESVRKAPDTRAGDIQLAYAVGKILDPDSVVREGELKLVGNSATVMERIQGELRTLVMGKGRLTPETRKELQTMLDTAVGERRNAYDAERKTYEGIAARRGYKPEDVFVGVAQSGVPNKGGKTVTADQVRARAARDGVSVDALTKQLQSMGVTVK